MTLHGWFHWRRGAEHGCRSRRVALPICRPCLEVLESRELLSASALPEPTLLTGTQPVPLQVVLVSDHIIQAEQVRTAATPGTLAVVYDSSTMTTLGLTELLDSIAAAHQGAQIGHPGIVTHGSPARIDLGASAPWELDALGENDPAWSRLRGLLTEDARLDLYACHVAATSQGKFLVDRLAALTGADVSASDNAVGSGSAGDFTWEYHTGDNAHARELFVLDRLEQVSGLRLDDLFEPNDSKEEVDVALAGVAHSPNLGLISTTVQLQGLHLNDAADWFRFETTDMGTSHDFVRIYFQSSQGDLDLAPSPSLTRSRLSPTPPNTWL